MKILNLFIGLLDPIIKLFHKYGTTKVIGCLVIVSCIAYTVISISNIENVVKNALIEEDYRVKKEHDAAMELRRNNNPKISQLMLDIMYKYNADRVSVIEFHNGTNNPSGLPFIYGEMTYEYVKDGIMHVDENYVKVNLSRYQLPFTLEKSKFYFGSADDIEKIDPKYAEKLKFEGTQYIAGYVLYGKNNELGYFGLSWVENQPPLDLTNMMADLGVTARKISILLDVGKKAQK